MKIFLLVYFAVYFTLVFVLRSLLLWRQTKINPFVLGRSDNVHDYVGRQFKLVVVATVLVLFAHAFAEKLFGYLTPISFLEQSSLKIFGLALSLSALLWTFIAQLNMGVSWRIGIDQQHQTPLVQRGLFRCSRNPIFLGMIAAQLALFCILPNAATLAILVASYLLIQIQVRLEEEYLSRVHGEAYADYRRRVRRWL